MLRSGGIGVIPTDTLYGVVSCAHNQKAVERVYRVKGRTPTKPCIILISNLSELEALDVHLNKVNRQRLLELWPGPVSVILTCGDAAPEYLHRGTHTLAFRFPKDEWLQLLVRNAGPLIAPSANPEGMPPATSAATAREYFGDSVDFYVDRGERLGPASTVIDLSTDSERIVR